MIFGAFGDFGGYLISHVQGSAIVVVKFNCATEDTEHTEMN